MKTRDLELATIKRNEFKNVVISVSGTCGKTTTTYFTHKVLKTCYKIDKSHSNKNGEVGIPVCINTMFDLNSDYWLQEIGIASPGAMKKHLDLLRPRIRILTNVNNAHSVYFKNMKHYQDEKLLFINLAPDDSTIIINNDDPLICAEKEKIIKSGKNIKIISCGTNSTDDVQLIEYKLNPNNIRSSFHVRINMNINQDIFFNLNCIGKHYGIDACLAIACGVYCDVPILYIQNALDNTNLYEKRGKIHSIRNLLVYDYTFNMVSAACINNLEEFNNIDSPNKVIIIGGNAWDVLEPEKSIDYYNIVNKAFKITDCVIVYNSKHLSLNTDVIGKFPLTKIINTEDEMVDYIKTLTKILTEKWYIFIQTPNVLNSIEIIKKL